MKKSKKSKKSNTWKIKQHRDQFFKKSKTLGYRSRSAFKLIELNKKYNFLEEGTKEKILKFFREKLDVVLSDMAANTTGNKSLDCIRTNQLCAEVVEFSSKILKPNGVLVSKLFMGEDFLEVKDLAKSRFKKVQFFKPEASRNESKETYLHCSILKTL